MLQQLYMTAWGLFKTAYIIKLFNHLVLYSIYFSHTKYHCEIATFLLLMSHSQ